MKVKLYVVSLIQNDGTEMFIDYQAVRAERDQAMEIVLRDFNDFWKQRFEDQEIDEQWEMVGEKDFPRDCPFGMGKWELFVNEHEVQL